MVLSTCNISCHLARYLCFLILTISACQDTVIDVQNLDYFPVKPSLSKIYEINEQIFEINDEPVNRNYFLKEIYTEIQETPNGSYFLIERYKSNDAKSWKIDSVWKGQKLINEVIISENNKDKVKLIFPLRDRSKFNVNKYNNAEPLEANVELIDQEFSLNNQKLNFLFSIITDNDSSLIDRKNAYEIYAPNTGLIQKTHIQLEYCQTSPDCIGKGIIHRGRIYNQKLTAVL